MKKVILLNIKLFFFWLLLFAFQHTVFLIYNLSEIKDIVFRKIILSYYYALSMDISADAYLMSLPAILLIIAAFKRKNSILIGIIHTVNIFLIIICTIISISDTALYSVWGTKINGKALSYMLYPEEAIKSFASVPYLLFIALIVFEGILAVFIYKRVFRPGFFGNINKYFKFIFPFVIIFLLIIAIRGGFNKYPINRSRVYFSTYSVLNYSALNGFWNFMELIINPDIKKNPYNYFPKIKAEAIVKAIHNNTSDESTEMILTTGRPNIVLILLESVSAECMGTLGGIKGLMPCMDSLTKQGLLFTNFYANGFRTEQGLIAFLSSFPAQPQTIISKEFDKLNKLSNMPLMLGNNGYSENYYYSGNLNFANMGAYLKSSGFTRIIGKNNYNWMKKTEWGAYDEELFDCHIKEGIKDSQPFFTVIVTSTNHEPFDANVEKVFKKNSDADNYKNTVFYTDKCLSDYLKKAQLVPLYKNTLFIITADHAHSMPLGRGYNEPERHRIPLLLYGNVLKKEYRGKTNNKIGSQIDLPAMLLSQLKIDYSSFARSKNLLNKNTSDFAFYTFDNGFGIITPQQTIVYDHNLKQAVYRKNSLSPAIDEEITNKGKAYMQVMFEEYIRLNN